MLLRWRYYGGCGVILAAFPELLKLHGLAPGSHLHPVSQTKMRRELAGGCN